MDRLRILQVFSRYEFFGGEEGSVYRIGDVSQKRHDVEYFLGSTAEILKMPLHKKLTVPAKAFHNERVAERIARYHQIGRFHLWQIHNVFPALSPSVYVEAIKLGVPMLHYLHNYRFGCVNGFMLHNGEICQKCIHGNFIPAVIGKTWRNSRVATAVMGAVLHYTRERIRLFDHVKCWVAISEHQKKVHVEMGIPADRIVVVPHFLNRRSTPPPLPVAGQGYALFVGRLSPEKGVDHLLRAWKGCSQGRKLVIAGEGPHAPYLKALTQQEGIPNVEFRGFVPKADQRALWEGALFSVVPSIWAEPFGMVILEAWAHQRAVVGYANGALPELITHGKSGLLAEGGNVEALEEQLRQAFANPDATAAMGLNGLHLLDAKYTERIYLDAMDRVYEQMLGGGTP